MYPSSSSFSSNKITPHGSLKESLSSLYHTSSVSEKYPMGANDPAQQQFASTSKTNNIIINSHSMPAMSSSYCTTGSCSSISNDFSYNSSMKHADESIWFSILLTLFLSPMAGAILIFIGRKYPICRIRLMGSGLAFFVDGMILLGVWGWKLASMYQCESSFSSCLQVQWIISNPTSLLLLSLASISVIAACVCICCGLFCVTIGRSSPINIIHPNDKDFSDILHINDTKSDKV